MYSCTLYPNMDKYQAVTIHARTRENLRKNIAAEIIARGWRDISTDDFTVESPASLELTYIECYQNFEVSDDGGVTFEVFEDFGDAAENFALTLMEKGLYNY